MLRYTRAHGQRIMFDHPLVSTNRPQGGENQTNDGSKTSFALPHRSRGQVSVGFHGIKKKIKTYSKIGKIVNYPMIAGLFFSSSR